jgi:two-component system alkaline phosphatase synthesis response regulator PhoP
VKEHIQDILIIADSEGYFSEVKSLLSEYDVPVRRANGAKKGIVEVKKNRPLGVILDVQLKESDGIEVCRELRELPEMQEAFVIFYTAEEEEYVHIAGLNAGADDYILKPSRPRIFLSRVKALVKRKRLEERTTKTSLIQNGNVIIDRERYRVIQDEKTIVLPRKEFELLCLFVARPGKVYSRAELYQSVWGDEQEVKGRTIDVHIRKIREKLGEESIRTVKGIGYKWSDKEPFNL